MIAALYLFVGVILSSLSSRFIFGGDSAEFSSIAHTWSIPHPPGYPLYSLLVNIITHLIPFGTIPWRASLLSVIPTVLASYVLFKILTHLKVKTFISLLASLLYIVLFPVWEYALVPEVFALNSLLVMTVTYFLLRYQDAKKNIYLFFSAFFVGLCVAHHHVFVIFVPGWFLLLRGQFQRIIKSGRIRFFILLFFLLGTSFYLYAPIASLSNPPIQWEDAKTLLGFWRLITRAAYGTFTAYGGSKGNIVNQLFDVFSSFVFIFQDFRIIGVACIGVGIWATLKKKNAFSLFLLITSLVYIFFLFYTNFMLSSSFSIGMYERFLIAFYAILIIYFAFGYDHLYRSGLRLVAHYSNKKSIYSIAQVCLVLCLVIYIGTVAKTNFRSLSSIRNGQDFDRLGKDIINTPPPGSIFFVGNDNWNFAAMYQVFGEGKKPPSIFFQINFMQQKYYIDQFKKRNPTLLFPPSLQNPKDLEQFIKLNKNRGIYLETSMPFGFWMPYGLLWKYYGTEKEGVADLKNIVKENTRLWTHVYHIPELTKDTRNILHLQTIQDLYVEAYTSYSELLYLAKETTQAQEVTKKIIEKYRPSNRYAKITLLNLLLIDKKCVEAQQSAQEILLLPIDSLAPEFVAPLANYYSICDPSSPRLPPLEKKIGENKEKSLTPLSTF